MRINGVRVSVMKKREVYVLTKNSEDSGGAPAGVFVGERFSR
jgi:hypothetical protein